MFFKKGQSLLEYALLFAVVIAGILIMQVLIKRGFQGGLKGSADKIGGQFSAGNTVISNEKQMTSDQITTEEVATTTSGEEGAIHNYTSEVQGTVDKGVLSLNKREGGDTSTRIEQQTESATLERVRRADYQTDTFDDFPEPFDPFN